MGKRKSEEGREVMAKEEASMPRFLFSVYWMDEKTDREAKQFQGRETNEKVGQHGDGRGVWPVRHMSGEGGRSLIFFLV